MADKKLIVSSSPHISTDESTKRIMLDVIIAMLPATIAGWFYFGYGAVLVVVTAVISCLFSEWIYQWLYRGVEIKNQRRTTLSDALKKSASKTDIGDLSAVVTGILIGLNMPPAVPLWMVAIGSAFAIIIVKQLFGGLGNNFVNPALAGRGFMLASWPVVMTAFHAPVMSFTGYIGVDAVSSATPLSIIKEAGFNMAQLPTLYDSFFGRIGGCIGETSAVLIIAGGLYLMIRKVIDCKIPLFYLGTFAVLMYLFGSTPYSIDFVAYNLCTGGIMLGAFFMATDYVTTPTTGVGHIIFGIGCGLLTFVIRRFGGYPEGTSYAILLMNIVTPLLDRYIRTRKFGEVKQA